MTFVTGYSHVVWAGVVKLVTCHFVSEDMSELETSEEKEEMKEGMHLFIYNIFIYVYLLHLICL